MRLFIAEKPAVAKDIAAALGGGSHKGAYIDCGNDKVSWLFGHVLQTVQPEVYNPVYKQWRKEDLPLKLYPPQYEISPDKVDHVNKVIELIKQADVIVHAGDPDDEGQLLVDELLIYSGNDKPVKRVLINDNTDKGVKKSLADLRDNKDFHGDYLKALSRSVGDEIYGLSSTRAYSIEAQSQGYRGVLSVGRVQTPTLGLIVRRWRANKAHSKSYYYMLDGAFTLGSGSLTARLQFPEDAPVDDKGHVLQKSYVDELAALVNGKTACVVEAAVKDKETAPKLPFNLSKLQQKMNRDHGMSAARTLEVTQGLREKFKAITYNRSDCAYLSDEQFSEAPDVVAALKASVAFADADVDTTRKSKAFNSAKVTAHTAIIPTDNVPDLDKLSTDERNVYTAIAKQYLIQFMPPKRFQEATGRIEANGQTFTYRATKEIHPGFEAYLKEPKEVSEDDAAETAFDVVSQLQVGQDGRCESATVQEKETTPPKLFDEASLISAMTRIADFVDNVEIKKLLKEKDKDNDQAHGSIGTEATRATIIETLKKRNFIVVEKGKLIPTETGLALFDALPDVATQPDMTALWFEQQLQIAEGKLTVDQFVTDLYGFLTEQLKDVNVGEIKGEKREDGKIPRLNEKCPSCNKEIMIRPKIYACTGCDFKIWATVAEKKLTVNQVETIIKKGKSNEIKGFTSKAGKKFDATLVLQDKATGKLGFEFSQKSKGK